MAANDRSRGSSRISKDKRKYIQGKQGKTDEIRRALTHRARLRKNYFKLLEKEGMDVPERETNNNVEELEEDESENDEEQKDEDNDKPMSEIELIKNKVQNRQALTFQERILLKKERKEKDKQRKMQKTREKLDTMKQRDTRRQRQRERIESTKTRKGQPLLGPRINSLLEKIRQDKN